VDAVVAARLGLIPCCLLQLPVRAPFVPAPLRAACLLVLRLCSAPAPVLQQGPGVLCSAGVLQNGRRGVLCPDLLLQGYFCLVLSVIEAGCPSHSFLLLVFCISAAPEVLCGWSVVQHSFILCFEYKY